MTAPKILIVDDQRDIVRLIHSTLDTLGHQLNIHEAPSGEEATLEASRGAIDLLITDYRLPGITGVELMEKIRARCPDVKTILITGMTDRKARDEMLRAGAKAIFDKPIPLGDFLDAVERCLGLRRTILPPEDDTASPAQKKTLANLLASYRQDMKCQAIFLLSERGRVLVRAGDLHDSSMEVSLISALVGIYTTSLKIARLIEQDNAAGFHLFRGSKDDFIMVPINTVHSLLAVGKDLADREKLLETMDTLLVLQGDVKKVLKDMGVATVPLETFLAQQETSKEPAPKAEEKVSDDELASLLKKPKKIKTGELEEFWEEAAEKRGPVPLGHDKLTYEQASKLGLTPEAETHGKSKK